MHLGKLWSQLAVKERQDRRSSNFGFFSEAIYCTPVQEVVNYIAKPRIVNAIAFNIECSYVSTCCYAYVMYIRCKLNHKEARSSIASMVSSPDLLRAGSGDETI